MSPRDFISALLKLVLMLVTLFFGGCAAMWFLGGLRSEGGAIGAVVFGIPSALICWWMARALSGKAQVMKSGSLIKLERDAGKCEPSEPPARMSNILILLGILILVGVVPSLIFHFQMRDVSSNRLGIYYDAMGTVVGITFVGLGWILKRWRPGEEIDTGYKDGVSEFDKIGLTIKTDLTSDEFTKPKWFLRIFDRIGTTQKADLTGSDSKSGDHEKNDV